MVSANFAESTKTGKCQLLWNCGTIIIQPLTRFPGEGSNEPQIFGGTVGTCGVNYRGAHLQSPKQCLEMC